MKKLLQDRKTLYLVLAVMIVSVFTLSIAYAAMSAVLEIHGNSEVVASTWDIHLENVKVKSGSVSANAPSISGTSSVGFDVELNTPGEYYEFTVDVVNGGSIDAMIDSVVKTPNLTTEQAKYIKYEITYANGESISTKQTLKKGTTTPIKVRVEYRKDLVAGDLPSTATELSLKLTLVYVQSDGTGMTIKNNGVPIIKIISGSYDKVGSEICFASECFYVISSTNTKVVMLAKYNLNTGNIVISSSAGGYKQNVSNTIPYLQNSGMIGLNLDASSGELVYPFYGVAHFSTSAYWNSDGTILKEYVQTGSMPYIFDSNSNLYKYLNVYGGRLQSYVNLLSAPRLIKFEELKKIGCTQSSCKGAPYWVYSTSYWTGTPTTGDKIAAVTSYGPLFEALYDEYVYGIRPVIEVSVDTFLNI